MYSLSYIFLCLLLGHFVQPQTENPWLIRSKELQGKLAKIVEVSVANQESLGSIINNAKDINSYITDDQVLQMVSRVLPSERYLKGIWQLNAVSAYFVCRCYLTTPLIDYRQNEEQPFLDYFDTPNLRKVTPDIIHRLKKLNLRELDFEVCRYTKILFYLSL